MASSAHSDELNLSDAQRKALVEAAEHFHRLYSEAFVEAFHLCPWAKRAREDGATRTEIILAFEDVNLSLVSDVATGIDGDDNVEVGFMIFPGLPMDRKEFARWANGRREENAALHHGSPPMAWAPFHPEADADFQSPAALVPFIRRSADPTIQMIRRSALEAVRKPADGGTAFVDPAKMGSTALAALLGTSSPAPMLHERVAEANLRTLKARRDEADASLRAIQEARNAAYSQILRHRS